ncbi:MAG: aconitase family protein [Planctomycetota bacterium]
MKSISLTPGKRVLFLTKDADLVRRQLRGELDLRMRDLREEDLLDDINTDMMTPAWVCFDYEPEKIAANAYAGLIVQGQRVFPERALLEGRFEVIVSGHRKGTGSSRETAVQAEKACGIRLAVAASFAPIHARNNVNLGVLMGNYDMLRRLQDGEAIPITEFTRGLDPVTSRIIEHGGLFPFAKALAEKRVSIPKPRTRARPMTMAEKILVSHLVGASREEPLYVKPGDAVLVRVEGGYSHEFTTAQVHQFLVDEYGSDYRVPHPEKFAVFEDHLVYADGVESMRAYAPKIQKLRDMQRAFQRHSGVKDYSATDGVSPGICHQVARELLIEPGELVQATDSHTCMGGGSNALAWGVGATEYANLIHSGFTSVRVPESIRFELSGRLREGVTAKDIMLHILCTYAKEEQTLDRVIEFGGPGLATLRPDERATLANMATECSAQTGIVEGDDELIRWIRAHRPKLSATALRAQLVFPDPDAEYAGGVHAIDLDTIEPMVATPGDPDRGLASDPKNGARISEIGEVPIDIAYGGSCTGGKEDDMELYTTVLAEAVESGRRVAEGVSFFIQCASVAVERHARERGLTRIFEQAGVRLIRPGCGACIGCGPGVSTKETQVTVSAINRNFKGRSGPGRLYLASPLTVAASAIEGKITAWRPGMWQEPKKRAACR